VQGYPSVYVYRNPFLKYIFSIKDPKLVFCVFRAYSTIVVRQFPEIHQLLFENFPVSSSYHPTVIIVNKNVQKREDYINYHRECGQ
jgi:hypothetical protein